MGQHIVKQPNGKYAIFSSVVDHFIAYDATPEEIAAHFRQESIENSDRQTARGITSADHFADARFATDIETVRRIHGDKEADGYLALLTAAETPDADGLKARMEAAESMCRSEGTPFGQAVAAIIRKALEKTP